MKFYFILCFAFELNFLSSSQNGTCILMLEHKRTNLIYIVCNMEFEDKTYGLNLLIVH
jgi:hypothetical protein